MNQTSLPPLAPCRPSTSDGASRPRDTSPSGGSSGSDESSSSADRHHPTPPCSSDFSDSKDAQYLKMGATTQFFLKLLREMGFSQMLIEAGILKADCNIRRYPSGRLPPWPNIACALPRSPQRLPYDFEVLKLDRLGLSQFPFLIDESAQMVMVQIRSLDRNRTEECILILRLDDLGEQVEGIDIFLGHTSEVAVRQAMI